MSAVAPPLHGNPLYVINLTTDRISQLEELNSFLTENNLRPLKIESIERVPEENKSFNMILLAHGGNGYGNNFGYVIHKLFKE